MPKVRIFSHQCYVVSRLCNSPSIIPQFQNSFVSNNFAFMFQMRQFTLFKITCLFSVSSVLGTGYQSQKNHYNYIRTARRSSLEPRESIKCLLLSTKYVSSDISYIPVSSSSSSQSSAAGQAEGRNFILQKLCELGLGEVNIKFCRVSICRSDQV